MKGSEAFKSTIKAYLDQRAAGDTCFATNYAKPDKSLDECCNYIFAQVQKSGCCGFCDDEIFGMAVHYYDEDIPKAECEPRQGGSVVVNHQVELTEEEKAEARKAAMEKYQAQMLADMRSKNAKPQKTTANDHAQLSLF